MKKIIAMVVTLLMVLSTSISTLAYNGDPTGYAYNYGYNNYNNYGYGYNYYNCTGIRTTYSDEEYQPSSWFDTYAEQYGVVFHLYPTMPISRSDVFAPVGKAMDNAYNDAGRTFSTAYGVSFRDFTWDSSLYAIAGGLYQRGIMVGYPQDNTVRMQNNITRAEFAKVVFLTAQQNGITTYSNSNINYQFNDMVGHWASQYASQCQALSLLVGRGNGYFDPDGYVTYEEYVTVMLRIAEITGRSNYSMDFEDIAYGISSTMDIDFEGYEYEEFELSASGSKTVYLTVGETEELKVKATPSDVELDESDIEWEASKTGYVRISGEDIENDRYATIQVKALKEGRVTVTAMASNDEDVSVDFTVVISEESEEEPEEETEETVYVSSIKLNPTSVKLELGDSKSITATVAPSNASNKGILWESHNEAVAIVDSNGKITAVGVGNTTVTATAKDGSGIIATIDVTVTATEEVVVPPSDTVSPKVQLTGADTVKERGKVKLIATAMDDNLKSFVITEQQISDLGTGLSISEITKVSDDTYEITLLGVEVSAVPVCINYGAAEDEAGNVSTDSNEVIIFVEANE